MIRYRQVTHGDPYPLGATVSPDGVNFAVFSQHASRVDICLFRDEHAEKAYARIRLPECTNNIWHGFAPGLKAGQLYGLRVYGPYRPKQGHRFNPDKLLLDPYAKSIAGKYQWGEAMFAYPLGDDPDRDLKKNVKFNSPMVPKCVVVDDTTFDWGSDQKPKTPMKDSVVYEVHVKGFSQQHPEIPESMRGTYAGLGSPRSIEYFKYLGVTAVELLPVQHFVNDEFLEARNLSNYWGYNTIGFFAPHALYSSSGKRGQQVTEFKQMVKNLHAAGIEVWLDVVYNHTGEGNHFGPTLSFRGIDNASYYWPMPNDPRYYLDHTGCGNSLNMPNPRVLQLIMDSLRYWTTEMRVDGFRFDLACTLGRLPTGFDRGSSFFNIIKQDPVLSQTKLIAEPWDIGMGGYQVGNFPQPFHEWNGKFRDCVRSYWKGDEGKIAELAKRFTGSSDLYEWDSRPPSAGVNFVVAHDGFTLADLVSYNEKHNEANCEESRDGESNNHSWNCGVEGPTDDPEILKLRRRQMRNLLATLILSHGVPMLCAGDEYGRTQKGNNNCYCQDNELSWLSWNRTEPELQQEQFTSRLIALKRSEIAFRPATFKERRTKRGEAPRMTWFNCDAAFIRGEEWGSPQMRAMAVVLSPDAEESGGTFLLIFNAHYDNVPFTLPGSSGIQWEKMIDTTLEVGFSPGTETTASTVKIEAIGRTFLLFRLAEGTPMEAHQPALPPPPQPVAADTSSA